MTITRPPWLKVKLPGAGQYYEVRRELKNLGVHTVCEEAHCPNAAECWGGGTATFMILGDICTRGCRFCAVTTGHPAQAPDPDEPRRITEAAAALKLRYVVLTSVDRDDLPDGGAAHFVQTVQTIKSSFPSTVVELLTPDFGGRPEYLELVSQSGAEVLGHNMETTRSLTPSIRDRRCDYDLSLSVLRTFRQHNKFALTKSSLLLGMGEEIDDVLQTMRDLREAQVDWIVLGQYLRPTRKHSPVRRFVPPEEFDSLAQEAKRLGFDLVTSGPLVRSSYRAAEQNAQELLAKRRSHRGND